MDFPGNASEDFESMENLSVEVHEGELIGLKFEGANPIPWTSVPCEQHDEQLLYALDVHNLKVEGTYQFTRAPLRRQPCREYSYTVLIGKA